jgi:adenylate cyclase
LTKRTTDTASKRCAGDLAAASVEPGFVLNELSLLRMRALVARAQCDDTAYRDLVNRYRDMARTLGFEGHIAWAEAMP